MLWTLNKQITRIQSISPLLFNRYPFFVPPIVAVIDPSVSTSAILKYVDRRRKQHAATIARWKLKNKLLPESKSAWSPVKTRNPLWPQIDSRVPPIDSMEGLNAILFAIKTYEKKHGPLFKPSSRGRPREYQYDRIMAVLIASTWTSKNIKQAVRDAVAAGFYLSRRHPDKVPPPSLISYVRAKLDSESSDALHEIIAITDTMCACLGMDLFDGPVVLKGIDWSGLRTSKYLIYSDLEGNPRLRRVAQQTTFVTRLITNTIPQVIIGEPHDVIDLLREPSGVYIGDGGYNSVRTAVESVKRGFLFLTPQVIDMLSETDIKKLAKRIYKFRKITEIPFGNFRATRVRIRSRREDFMFQEVLMWAIAKNIRSHMRLRALQRMVYSSGRQRKKELIYEAINLLVMGVREELEL